MSNDLGRFAGAVIMFAATAVQAAEKPTLHVPDGFVVECVAREPQVVYPMFAAFDESGRLFVAESSGLDLYAELKALTRRCRIRLLEDPDERGRFRKSRIFADKLVFPMGLVWRDGKLYVADPPDLITLEDTDGDGQADRRTVLLSGFGHLDNGSLHGLTFGPDGMLYMTMGQPDGYQIKRRDGSLVHGKTGALLRCRPDGSDPEVLCRGFENLVEVVFTPRGDIIGTDNWFKRPQGGLRDALVHLLEGGLYPLHADRGTPQAVTGEFLPAVALFPAVALSGLERYRGQAFKGFQGHLFSAQHNARKVGRHVLLAHGATFRSQDFDFLTCDSPDFHPSDVLEDADGSLLVLDTGSWYVHHCPTGQIRKIQATGGIHRVRRLGAPVGHDPRGWQIDWAKTGLDTLITLLGDSRPTVRERAQRTLTARGRPAIAPLAAALLQGHDLLTRQHALWALAGITDPAAAEPLKQALSDLNPDIVIPAARALGLRRDGSSTRQLIKLLRHQEVAVRLAAAEAMARSGHKDAVGPLAQALTQDVDVFLEHALVHALYHLADTQALEGALDHPHPRVQKAALVLLDQPPRPRDFLKPGQVLSRLQSADGNLRQTAVGILRNHPEWAAAALGLLRGWLEQPRLTVEEERSLRELALAFLGKREVQDLLAQVMCGQEGRYPVAQRILVLETMAQGGLAKIPPALAEGLRQASRPGTPASVRVQAVRTAAVLQLTQLDEPLARLAEDAQENAELRLESLRAVVLRRPRLSAAAFKLVMTALVDEDQPLARLGAAEIVGRAHLDDLQVAAVVRAIGRDSLVGPSVVLPALLRMEQPATSSLVQKYLAAAIDRGWRPAEQEWQKLQNKFSGKALEDLTLRARRLADKQAQRLAEFEPLLKGGDQGRGRAVFFSKKATCATCHRLGAEGGTVGPDLTRIGTVRAGRDLLEAILAPSASFAQGFDPYVFLTDDGQALNGLLVRQTADAVIIRDASGAELQLPRTKIQEMRRSTVSVMPEGLERLLSRDEFRDLLAFLQSLK